MSVLDSKYGPIEIMGVVLGVFGILASLFSKTNFITLVLVVSFILLGLVYLMFSKRIKLALSAFLWLPILGVCYFHLRSKYGYVGNPENPELFFWVVLSLFLAIMNYFITKKFIASKLNDRRIKAYERSLGDFTNIEIDKLGRISNLKRFNMYCLTLLSKDKELRGLNWISHFFSNRHLISYSELNNLEKKDIKNYKFVIDQFEGFQFSDDGSDAAWFVSLVAPNVWFDNIDWKNKYIFPMFVNSARKKKVDIRRIYVMKKSDYIDSSKNYYKKVNAYLLIEKLVGVDTKMLLIKSNNKNAAENYEIAGISPLDFALFYSHITDKNYFLRTNKLVACSEIVPYFLRNIIGDIPEYKDIEKVNIFPLIKFDAFNKFKEQFLKLWYLEEYDKSFETDTRNVEPFTNKLESFSFLELLANENYMKTSEIDWHLVASTLNEISTKLKLPLRTSVSIATKELESLYSEFTRAGDFTEEHFYSNFHKYTLNRTIQNSEYF